MRAWDNNASTTRYIAVSCTSRGKILTTKPGRFTGKTISCGPDVSTTVSNALLWNHNTLPFFSSPSLPMAKSWWSWTCSYGPPAIMFDWLINRIAVETDVSSEIILFHWYFCGVIGGSTDDMGSRYWKTSSVINCTRMMVLDWFNDLRSLRMSTINDLFISRFWNILCGGFFRS